MGFNEFVALLPPPLQFTAYVIAALVTAHLVRTEYRKKRDAPIPAGTDVIVAGGSFMEMKPVREINEHLAHLVTHTAAATLEQRRTADALVSVAEIMNRTAEGERMDHEIQRRLGEALSKLGPK